MSLEALLAEARDPRTPPARLTELAGLHPQVRASVALNPNAYPDLLEWLETHGDSTVVAAVAARRNADGSPPVREHSVGAPLRRRSWFRVGLIALPATVISLVCILVFLPGASESGKASSGGSAVQARSGALDAGDVLVCEDDFVKDVFGYDYTAGVDPKELLDESVHTGTLELLSELDISEFRCAGFYRVHYWDPDVSETFIAVVSSSPRLFDGIHAYAESSGFNVEGDFGFEYAWYYKEVASGSAHNMSVGRGGDFVFPEVVGEPSARHSELYLGASTLDEVAVVSYGSMDW